MATYLHKPAVSKAWLLLCAGGLWSIAGVMLLRFALSQLTTHPGTSTLTIISFVTGIILGGLIALIGFSRIAKKNINRIRLLPNRCCIFAFQKWHAYLLVCFMMTLGIFLRKSQLISPLLLVTFYTGIGTALLTSSCLYYRELYKQNQTK
mgnify:CR=1 FL=1